jgi:cysteine-rich repeat protein
MFQRKYWVVVLVGLTACTERMRIVGTPDGGVNSSTSIDGAVAIGDVGPGPDFGFFVPDAPPPRDLSLPDITLPDLPPPVCGNKLLEGSEGCDDGNLTPGDGCTATCTVEPEHVCPFPGMPCVRNVVCGDRKQTGGEACDDGNVASGDGCSPTCVVESGWSCARGAACRPRCGDGIILAPEQ